MVKMGSDTLGREKLSKQMSLLQSPDFLLQGIFLTQGSNSGLLNCRHILYHLSHQGSPNFWFIPSPQLQIKKTPAMLKGNGFFISIF